MWFWVSKRRSAADGQVGACFPIVLHVRFEVEVVHTRKRVAGNQRKLARSAAVRLNLGRGQTRLQALFGNLIGLREGKVNVPLKLAVDVADSSSSRNRTPNFKNSCAESPKCNPAAHKALVEVSSAPALEAPPTKAPSTEMVGIELAGFWPSSSR